MVRQISGSSHVLIFFVLAKEPQSNERACEIWRRGSSQIVLCLCVHDVSNEEIDGTGEATNPQKFSLCFKLNRVAGAVCRDCSYLEVAVFYSYEVS